MSYFGHDELRRTDAKRGASVSGFMLLMLLVSGCLEDVANPVDMADSGSLVATVNTTVSGGATIDPMELYELQIWEGTLLQRSTTFAADTNSTLRDPITGQLRLPPGNYSTDGARLAGIAPTGERQISLAVSEECTVSGENPRSVSIPVFDSAQTTFEVSCTASAD